MNIKELLYDWHGINTSLFYLINGFHAPIYDQFMILGSSLGAHQWILVYFPFLLVFSICSLSFTYARERNDFYILLFRWMSALTVLMVSYTINAMFITWCKNYFQYPRPPYVLPPETVYTLGPTLQLEQHFVSFPSGHASFATLLVVSLWPLFTHTWHKVLGCLFVLWVALSRISLGAHFPADVLLGIIGALTITLLVHLVISMIIHYLAKFQGETLYDTEDSTID